MFLCVVLFVPTVVYADDVVYTSSAYSCVVMDGESKTVFHCVNENQPLPMASTTKIMTCLIACEMGNLNDVVTITDEMVNTEGSMIYLKSGDKITLLDLVKGALIASGNDAANAIAIHIGSTLDDFCSLMNKKAVEIGMTNTVFVTPSGLDEGNHHSTAYDMALLTAYALDCSEFAQICAMQTADITINDKTMTVYNHNKLLSYSQNFVGVKTGYTNKAGRCLVSAYNHNGNNIICVTLNDYDDWADHKQMINCALNEYNEISHTQELYIDAVGSSLTQIKCSYQYNITTLGDVNIKLYYYPFVYAPVNAGDKVGYANIYSNQKLVKTVPITATEGINYYGKQQSDTTSEVYGG